MSGTKNMLRQVPTMAGEILVQPGAAKAESSVRPLLGCRRVQEMSPARRWPSSS